MALGIQQHQSEHQHKRTADTDQHNGLAQPLDKVWRVGIVNEVFQTGDSVDHTQLEESFSHTLPAPWVHMTDLDEVRHHQRTHGLSFELQVRATFIHRILVEQQVYDLLGVIHRVAPAAQGSAAEGLDPLWMLVNLGLAGEQDVAVEIDPIGGGRDDVVFHAPLLQVEGLVGQVRVERRHFTAGQIPNLKTAGQQLQFFEGYTLATEHRQKVGICLCIHQHHRLADQVVHRANTLVCARHEHGRRVLKNHRQRNQGLAMQACVEQFTIGFAVLGTPREHFFDRCDLGATFVQAHVQPFFAVIALGDGGVVARELELMFPTQLNINHLFGAIRLRASPRPRSLIPEQHETQQSTQPN